MISTGQTTVNDMLWRLVQGPKHLVKTYKKYRANGFVFSPKYNDDQVVTQDSGVCMKALTQFRARKSDKNLKESWTMYYGVIRQIIELDYTTFKEVVFYCDWVRVEDKTNGCKLCPNSNLVVVNLDKFKSSDNDNDEPVILASEASQVFYSKDLKNPNWWVVVHSPKRLTSRESMSRNTRSFGPTEPSVTRTQDEVSEATNENQKPKLKMTLDDDGTVVGPNAQQFQSRAGDLVRALLPISFNEFGDVPMNFKDDVWNALMSEFELDIPEVVAREVIVPTWSQKFRSHKSSLRKELKQNPDLQPKGVDPLIWKGFLANERNPKKIAERLRNAENRRKLEYSHTLGRQSYAQKHHKLEEQNPGKEIIPEDVWLVGHKRKDGTVLTSAKPIYEAISAASKKRKNYEKGSSSSFSSINNSPVAEVLGPHKRGGIRGKGTYITKKRVIHSAVAKAKLAELKDKQIANQTEMINKMSSELSDVKTTLQAVLKRLPPYLMNSSPLNDTPTNEYDQPSNENGSPTDDNANTTGEKGSTSAPGHSVSHNLEAIFTPSVDVTRPRPNGPFVLVNLCDKFGKKLARGHLVTDHTAGTCHFRKIRLDERKVHVNEFFVPDAPIYDAPQGPNNTLHDFVMGGYLIWLQCHLDYY